MVLVRVGPFGTCMQHSIVDRGYVHGQRTTIPTCQSLLSKDNLPPRPISWQQTPRLSFSLSFLLSVPCYPSSSGRGPLSSYHNKNAIKPQDLQSFLFFLLGVVRRRRSTLYAVRNTRTFSCYNAKAARMAVTRPAATFQLGSEWKALARRPF